MRVLLIEDDRKAAKLLTKGFQEEGFVVDVAPTGEVGEEQAAVNEYDVMYGTRKDRVEVVWAITGRGHSQ